MLLEDLLLAGALGLVATFVLVPVAHVLKSRPWRRRDPIAEARERLRLAKLEAEAARLHREADQIYEDMYRESLADEAEGAPVEDAPASEDAARNKGK